MGVVGYSPDPFFGDLYSFPAPDKWPHQKVTPLAEVAPKTGRCGDKGLLPCLDLGKLYGHPAAEPSEVD